MKEPINSLYQVRQQMSRNPKEKFQVYPWGLYKTNIDQSPIYCTQKSSSLTTRGVPPAHSRSWGEGAVIILFPLSSPGQGYPLLSFGPFLEGGGAARGEGCPLVRPVARGMGVLLGTRYPIPRKQTNWKHYFTSYLVRRRQKSLDFGNPQSSFLDRSKKKVLEQRQFKDPLTSTCTSYLNQESVKLEWQRFQVQSLLEVIFAAFSRRKKPLTSFNIVCFWKFGCP